MGSECGWGLANFQLEGLKILVLGHFQAEGAVRPKLFLKLVKLPIYPYSWFGDIIIFFLIRQDGSTHGQFGSCWPAVGDIAIQEHSTLNLLANIHYGLVSTL